MNIKGKIRNYFDYNKKCVKHIVRASNYYHQGGIKRQISFFLHRRNRKKFNIEIYPNVVIGKSLDIPHCVGIVIGKTAIIGDNCIIFPNVTIGARYSPTKENNKKRHASIGNNCILGAGCKIIGDIEIGNNVVIGANAVVTKNIPNNCTVINNNEIID